MVRLLQKSPKDVDEVIEAILGANKQPLDLYYAMRKDTDILKKGIQMIGKNTSNDLN